LSLALGYDLNTNLFFLGNLVNTEIFCPVTFISLALPPFSG